MRFAATLELAAIISGVCMGQQIGQNQEETHPPLASQVCTSSGGCQQEQTKVVLDANWRWLHKVGAYSNCYTGNQWDSVLCSDPEACATNCVLEGADYTGTYGITTSNDGELRLKFVTKHAYGTNIGSRVYLLQDDEMYKLFHLLNQEFSFEVDASQLPCGMNGALYFVQMDEDGGMARFPSNRAGAAYGTGYCDAQCPHDLKFINGEANVVNWTGSGTDPNSGDGKYGSCCMEMDIWEANSISNAFTSHPCTVTTQTRCSSPTDCGDNNGFRYQGVCDKDGCDFNPFRMGNRTFYGPGSQFTVESTKPVTVVTQFITNNQRSDGELVEVKRFFKQDGRIIENSASTWDGIDATNSISDTMCDQTKQLFGDPNDHASKGKLRQMGVALQRGVVLAMSIWGDHLAHCLWLDSSYPVDKAASTPGVQRGTCATSSGDPKELVQNYPEATVRFRSIRVGDIGSTTP